jgi:hypothetical protein
METIFKTLINNSGEYGIIEVGLFEGLLIGTSQKPNLYAKEATIEDLKKYYSDFRVDPDEEQFDWETHIPKDWKLVTVEVKIKPEPSKNPFSCFGRKPHPMDFESADDFDIRIASWLAWEAEFNK